MVIARHAHDASDHSIALRTAYPHTEVLGSSLPEPLRLFWTDLQSAVHVAQGQAAADMAIHMLGLLSPTPYAEPKDKSWVGGALAACSSCTAFYVRVGCKAALAG